LGKLGPKGGNRLSKPNPLWRHFGPITPSWSGAGGGLG
jgi:hypothetical protein